MSEVERMDLRDIPCPQNTSRILLKLAGLDSGQSIEVILRVGEPYDNVRSSLEDEAYRIVSDEPMEEQLRLLRIQAD